jgi:predicted DNA-binding transcriptional regulator AlpA
VSAASTPKVQFLRLAEVAEIVRLSRWTIRRLTRAGLFPAPAPASPRRAYYVAADVQRWLVTRQSAGHAAAAVARPPKPSPLARIARQRASRRRAVPRSHAE